MTQWIRLGGVLFVAGAIAVMTAGCQAKNPQASAPAIATPKARSTGGKLKTVKKTVSDDDAQKFADSLVRDVSAGSAQACNKYVDWAAINDTATNVPNATPGQRSGFARGVNQEILGPNGIFAEVVKQVKAGGSYELLRIHELDGETRVLFRLALPEAGLNYHDLPLAKGPDGIVKARDFFPYLTGEFLSTTLRRSFLPYVANQNRGIVDKLIGREGDYMRSLDLIEALGSARQTGKNREAIEIFSKLPDSVKKEKHILLMRLLSAQAVDEAEYGRAIEDIHREYPNDASIDMLMVDGYILKKDYAAALAAVDRLDKALGGDPYLDTLRCNIQFTAGDSAAAKTSILKAIEHQPGLITPYWTLIGLTLKEKQFDETLKWLRTVEKKFQLELSNFSTIPEYAEFAKSPQFQEWRKDHPDKP